MEKINILYKKISIFFNLKWNKPNNTEKKSAFKLDIHVLYGIMQKMQRL